MSGADAPRLIDFLDHIVHAIGRILEYVDGLDEQAFERDTKTQDAVIRNFEIIGEASRNIEKRYPAFAVEHAEVPWAVAYEMRNVLSHGYFKVDIGVVWRTIERDLPQLQKTVRELRAAATR
jgi:uncharacterized protein with HEPN domain